MESYNPNNPAYEPTDVSFGSLIMDVYKAGAVIRDF